MILSPDDRRYLETFEKALETEPDGEIDCLEAGKRAGIDPQGAGRALRLSNWGFLKKRPNETVFRITYAGIVALHPSHWRSISSRVRETRSGGVVVRDRETGGVDVDIHAEVAWGSVIPELAADVETAVRRRVTGLLNLDLDCVTFYVDEIAGPLEEKAHKKS